MTATPSVESIETLSHRLFERGLLLAARESCERWCDRMRAGDPARSASSLNALGSVYIELGLLSQALGLFQEALAWQVGASPTDTVRSLCNMSLCHYLLGKTGECIRAAELARERAKAAGIDDPALLAHVDVLLGIGYCAASRWEEAIVANLRAKALLKELNDPAGVAKTLNNLGVSYVESGRYDEGERLLLESISQMEHVEDLSTRAYTYTELGRLYYKKGDLAQALRYGSQALRILWDNMGLIDKAEVARLCDLFGAIAEATGDRSGALNYMQRATTYYAQQGLWREWSAATRTLDEIIRKDAGERSSKVAIGWEDKQILRYFTTLLGLMDTLECLYPHLRGKSELVTKYSLLLGEALGIDRSDRERLSHAARLHDVGLTSMEIDQEIVPAGVGQDVNVTHPVLGERVLKMFGAPAEVQRAVRHHHEHYDGSGVPDGLAGEEIPIFSRIIAVADAYVTRAIGAEDPKHAHSRALAAVAAEAGRRFDPAVIRVFIDLHEV